MEDFIMDYQSFIELTNNYYMNTFTRYPIVFDYGENSTLYDIEGNPYTDFLAGIAVNTLGYAHPRFTKALTEQCHKLLHCSNLFYTKPQAKLAKLLIEESAADRVFFANSGAEANEGAIKLARMFFYKQGVHKYEIITTSNSFHGRTLATLTATGQEKYHAPLSPLPPGFINVPFNDIEAVEAAINENTCAVMIEPIQGEGGIVEANMVYMKGLYELCKAHNILLIFDEIQTGMGRTGKLFAYEHYGIEPDIFTLAKGLGGGIPIGAVLAKEDVATAFEPGDHGSTFGGNAFACSAGACIMEILLEDDSKLIRECATKGDYFKEKLLYLQDSYPHIIKGVRGKGLMLGAHLYDSIDGGDIVKSALDMGFIINCAGNNTLRFVPPLIISTDEIDKLISALDVIFKTL